MLKDVSWQGTRQDSQTQQKTFSFLHFSKSALKNWKAMGGPHPWQSSIGVWLASGGYQASLGL